MGDYLWVASDTELFQLPRAEPLLIRGHRGGEYVFRKEKESKEGQHVYSIEEERKAFDRAQSVGTEAAYQKYIDEYPSGIFREVVAFRVDQLRANASVSKEKEGNSKRRSSSTQKKSASLAEEKIEKELGIEMMRVAGGTFWRGDDESKRNREKPAHRVQLDSFYIGKYPITQGQWKAVMGKNPSKFKDCYQCPVEYVSWKDIQRFLKKLNARYPGKNYRLPTEAEWEYAARGGQLSKGYKYAGSNNLDEVGWYKENSDDKTHAVGQKHPNELGIYDMSGNVLEWCADKYSDTYYQECHTEGIIHNPKGPEYGEYRVVRGGSCYADDNVSRVSSRYLNFDNPYSRVNVLGFRLCRY